MTQPVQTQPAVSRSVVTEPLRPRHLTDRPTPTWLLTAWAAVAALAVCVVTVFHTPLEPPAAWRATGSAVVSVGRHALPEDVFYV